MHIPSTTAFPIMEFYFLTCTAAGDSVSATGLDRKKTIAKTVGAQPRQPPCSEYPGSHYADPVAHAAADEIGVGELGFLLGGRA